MSDHCTDRLSEYLDGELPPDAGSAVAAHLATCASCRSTLQELRMVVSAAASLPDVAPPRDLWPAIVDEIRGGSRAAAPVEPLHGPTVHRRFSFSAPQLAAAALALILLSGGTTWWLAGRPGPPERIAADGGVPATPAESAVQFVSDTEISYGAAIRALEQELAMRGDAIDPATARTIESNLAIIDAAIAEATAALVADPSNGYLYRHLDNTLMKKVEVLRRATRLSDTET